MMDNTSAIKSKYQLRKNTTFINLAGLFKIIINSRKNNIKNFMAWKFNTPVGGTTITSHFDISGTYQIQN